MFFYTKPNNPFLKKTRENVNVNFIICTKTHRMFDVAKSVQMGKNHHVLKNIINLSH